MDIETRRQSKTASENSEGRPRYRQFFGTTEIVPRTRGASRRRPHAYAAPPRTLARRVIARAKTGTGCRRAAKRSVRPKTATTASEGVRDLRRPRPPPNTRDRRTAERSTYLRSRKGDPAGGRPPPGLPTVPIASVHGRNSQTASGRPAQLRTAVSRKRSEMDAPVQWTAYRKSTALYRMPSSDRTCDVIFRSKPFPVIFQTPISRKRSEMDGRCQWRANRKPRSAFRTVTSDFGCDVT